MVGREDGWKLGGWQEWHPVRGVITLTAHSQLATIPITRGISAMATNDAIVLRASFEEWNQRVDGLDEHIDAWLYYCLEQYLKQYAIDDEDVEAGNTDRVNDRDLVGGYFLVIQATCHR